MKKLAYIILLLPFIGFAQSEKHPVFKACEETEVSMSKNCFYTETNNAFFKEFIIPTIIITDKYKETVTISFIVNEFGKFRLINVGSPYQELNTEVERVFSKLPIIKPAMNNGHATEMRFLLPLHFPNPKMLVAHKATKTTKKHQPKEDLAVTVAKNKIAKATFLEDNSQLNVPFTHQNYVDYEFAMHKATGSHTGSKPYLYSEVSKYFDISSAKKQFLKPVQQSSWIGKKIWNEHLLQVKKKDYWLTLDFLFDLQIGKDNTSVPYTFNNSRILKVQGAIGSKFAFSASVFESQGRFAEYINSYISNPALNFRPLFSDGLVPGRGKSKGFKTDSYDYPVAEGYVSYTPNKFMQFQFGQGKNFLGDGYRSFLLSDVSSPSTYLKIKAKLWKFQYTNIWLWATEPSIRDINNGNLHARKYVATHYLSINLTDRLNIGLFETSISSGQGGFDIGFLNPLMFYRAVEFSRGEDAGNAMVGLTTKFKATNNISLYSQLVIDEFSVGNLKDLSDWRNKFATQVGIKYFDAFDVKNLFLQAEFNYARPYTFAHKSPILNYGNQSQPLGHSWGANFWEAVIISRYKKDRWFGSAKLVIGKKGFDFQNQAVSFGGDIYQPYTIRQGDTGNELAQGNTASLFLADFQGNYLLNPATNTSLFANLSFRNIYMNTPTNALLEGTTVWFSVGLKADLFNWYFDF